MPDVIENAYTLEQAFILMEVEPPSSFDDGTAKAKVAQRQFGRAFLLALEHYDWSFARKLAVLPLVDLEQEEIAADPDLPYAVRLPTDCVKLRRVYLGTSNRWRIDSDLIRSDMNAPLTVRYTSDTYRLKFMPQSFQQVVAYHLALLLAPKWVKTRTKRTDLRSEMNDAIYSAKVNDGFTASTGRTDGKTEFVDWADEAKT